MTTLISLSLGTELWTREGKPYPLAFVISRSDSRALQPHWAIHSFISISLVCRRVTLVGLRLLSLQKVSLQVDPWLVPKNLSGKQFPALI